MIKRIIYFGIIVILTILLINYFGTKNNFQLSNEETINASELVNNARYNPKRLYLSTWRLVKSKYYDPTLNKQDWYRWRSRYIDKIKTQEDAYVAINTMLASLNDQYSRFMSEDEFKSQNEEIDAKITGIGVTISSISGKIVILDVLKNTPANKAGIKPGDILTKVNGKDVHGLDLSDVSKLIRGPIGSVVGGEFLRDKKKISYNIQRREIEIQSVESEMMNNGIGYIKISSFIGVNVAEHFLQALEQTKNSKGLIIDLRGNTGGLLPNALLIASLFIPNGEIVSVVDRNGSIMPLNAQRQTLIVDKPTVILVDGATASASEILSGALSDYGIATLVGQKTYGKGMIQKIYPLPNRTGLNLTIAKYLTPKGTDINKVGIVPDYKIEYTYKDHLNHKDPQLEKAKSILNLKCKTCMATH